jgi:hypothetical protein
VFEFKLESRVAKACRNGFTAASRQQAARGESLPRRIHAKSGPRFWSGQFGEQRGLPKLDAEGWDGLRRAG